MSAVGVQVAALIAAATGSIALVFGLWIDPGRTWISYLQAWTFGTTVCAGALVLLMMGHAAKAGWMVVIRRIAEAIVSGLPLYLALFVPLGFGLRFAYSWDSWGTIPGEMDRPGSIRYLTPAFFIARTVAYFAVFITVGFLLRTWSRANDRQGDAALVRRMRKLGAGALPVVGLALSWASFDWTMSLDAPWVSTIFGLYFFAGGFVGAIALIAIALHLAGNRVEGNLPVTGDHAQALGRLLFAMVVFWAYMAFSQFLIDWIGDIPEEITYFARRTTGSWAALTAILVLGMFVAPFFALLNRRLKRRTGYLAAVGVWIFVMHYVDVYWMVMPVHDVSGVRPHWLDLGAILFFGGLSCAWITRSYVSAAPLPRNVPELAEGLRYEAAL